MRLTPARAGNTFPSVRRMVGATAHPRSRGEHADSRLLYSWYTGSPPLARGTHRRFAWRVGTGRLTPARAGNTSLIKCRWLTPAAHPRSRGEHQACSLRASRLIGSPPLARGTHSPPPPSSQRRRLIPARAGNTRLLKHLSRRAQAHPRSRGEHCLNRLDGFLFFGSPPLARGTRLALDQTIETMRLTPARAGNTASPPQWARTNPAHPRSRGEHFLLALRASRTPGSPPLARGTRTGNLDRLPDARLTPARAGNT